MEIAMTSHPERLVIQPQFDDGQLLEDSDNASCPMCQPECRSLAKRVICDVASEVRTELAQVCPLLCTWRAPPIFIGAACCLSVFDVGFAVVTERLVGFPAMDIFISLLVLEFGILVLAGVFLCAWHHTRHELRRSKGQRLDDMMVREADNSLLEPGASADP